MNPTPHVIFIALTFFVLSIAGGQVSISSRPKSLAQRKYLLGPHRFYGCRCPRSPWRCQRCEPRISPLNPYGLCFWYTGFTVVRANRQKKYWIHEEWLVRAALPLDQKFLPVRCLWVNQVRLAHMHKGSDGLEFGIPILHFLMVFVFLGKNN